MQRIGSVIFWGFVVLSSAVLFPIAVLIWVCTAPFDPRKRALHQFTCFWASLYTWLNPAWPVTIHGRDVVEKNTTYVYVANHLSLLDILVLFRLFYDFKWVSKAEIFKVPVIGWNMRMNGYIPLRRGEKQSVIEMMAASARALAAGSSLMIFPEGTRSASGELQALPASQDPARQLILCLVPLCIKASRGEARVAHGIWLQR